VCLRTHNITRGYTTNLWAHPQLTYVRTHNITRGYTTNLWAHPQLTYVRTHNISCRGEHPQDEWL